jgi:hypothetical protein
MKKINWDMFLAAFQTGFILTALGFALIALALT